jgi:hypothetical protein
MADPGAQVGGRMLMAVLVCIAERMMQLQDADERREDHNAEAQDGEQDDARSLSRHHRGRNGSEHKHRDTSTARSHYQLVGAFSRKLQERDPLFNHWRCLRKTYPTSRGFS